MLKTPWKRGSLKTQRKLCAPRLREFISHRRFELMERQQLQDIAWALNEKSAAK